MDSPALGKAELVVGGCASWAFSKGGRRKLLRSKAQKKTAQQCEQHEHHAQRHSRPRTCNHPAQLRLLEHRLHKRLQGMLTGAPVLCVWGVILDLACVLPKRTVSTPHD